MAKLTIFRFSPVVLSMPAFILVCGCLTHRQATSLAGLATMVGDDSLMNCACVVVDVPPVNERGQAQFLTLFQSAGAVSRNARRRFFYMYHYPCYPVFLDME